MTSKYFKEILSSPVDIMKNFFLYRHLLLQMVIREIKGRFAGSLGGILWHFIHPILMLVVYLFVFVYIFKLRVSASGGAGASAIYLIAGLFPWIILSEGLSRGTSALIENANLIQKTSFPNEILIAKSLLAPIFSYGIALVLLALYKIVFSGSISLIIALPLVVILQIIFTLGIVFITATVSIFFRDILQLVHVLIGFWMYLTPILYPMSMLPDWAQKIMYFNPLYPFIAIYQSLFVEGSFGQLNLLLIAVVWSLLFYIAGSFIFNKLKYEFADWL